MTPPSRAGASANGLRGRRERVERLRGDEGAVGHDDERAGGGPVVREGERDRLGVPAPGVHEHVDPVRGQARIWRDE